ncbi:MAG: SMP-30/gluconolactonase/LRE family protein [Acidobacteria bacterium]|nr:SMP-30/gluconolactonase/LRE family protein [Acidobacteriota bacterium]
MPDPFVAYADEFHDVLGSNPTYESIPADAHEGPVYVRDWNAVLFTSVPERTDVPAFGDRNVQIGRLDVAKRKLSVFREASNMGNGMTLDREGRLLICEQGSLTTPARISRLDLQTGAIETVTDRWFGLPFNSPNDVVVKSDGTIWFTDPSYGALQGFRPPALSGDYVYRCDPREKVSTAVVLDSFNKPNGLCFSPDESILYVNDSGAIQGPGTYYPALPHHIKAFDVIVDGNGGARLGPGRLFATITPGIPDGLKCDSAGRVYSSSFSGVQVFSPEGRILGEIVAPGVANFCFGGERNDTLFLMCDSEIVIARIAATGA